jgi:hypothetical protein
MAETKMASGVVPQYGGRRKKSHGKKSRKSVQKHRESRKNRSTRRNRNRN